MMLLGANGDNFSLCDIKFGAGHFAPCHEYGVEGVVFVVF